ncbi:MAG: archease [Thaumarchaeota archaeon]|nr:archease [Nitrososphaerota archaeon]
MTAARFRFLPDIALADIAFAASADSLGELFESCAAALTTTMVDRRTLRAKLTKEVEMKAEDSDGLLYDFLTQLIIMKDVDSLLFKRFTIEVSKDGKSLRCKMTGEPIDRESQALRNDVKAVTMHMFGINRGRSGSWDATVVLDI